MNISTVGLFYTYFNTQLLAAICLAGSTVFISVIPFNRTLYGMIGTFFLNGVTMGMLDSGKLLQLIAC